MQAAKPTRPTVIEAAAVPICLASPPFLASHAIAAVTTATPAIAEIIVYTRFLLVASATAPILLRVFITAAKAISDTVIPALAAIMFLNGCLDNQTIPPITVATPSNTATIGPVCVPDRLKPLSVFIASLLIFPTAANTVPNDNNTTATAPIAAYSELLSLIMERVTIKPRINAIPESISARFLNEDAPLLPAKPDTTNIESTSKTKAPINLMPLLNDAESIFFTDLAIKAIALKVKAIPINAPSPSPPF